MATAIGGFSNSNSAASSSKPPPKIRPDPVPKCTPSTSDPFAGLPPVFDADRFQPPEWARDMSHLNKSSGETDEHAGKWEAGKEEYGDEDDTASLGLSEQETLWEDAREEFDDGVDEATGEFTLAELKGWRLIQQRLFDKATGLKTEGNTHFTARPPRYDDAVQAYQSALGCLPERKPVSGDLYAEDGPSNATRVGSDSSRKSASTPSTTAPTTAPPPPPTRGSGIQELTEAEAAALEAELLRSQAAPSGSVAEDEEQPRLEEEQREGVYAAIKELRKVCYGNLGAVFLAQTGKEKECVEVCTKALKIDPKYTKALQRRATANDRLNTWSSLTSAQEDYTALLSLLPSSALLPVRRALVGLPERIKVQQEKEKDEMMSKLKDLGNGLLGKFGLSTDMFKFDQQEGGGYSMRFER